MVTALRVALLAFLFLRAAGGLLIAFYSPSGWFSIFALALASGYLASLWGVLKREEWGYWFAAGLVVLDLLSSAAVLVLSPSKAGAVAIALALDLITLRVIFYLKGRDLKGKT
jgi:hypothetical protein